ncbi:GGDEF domain-containing protein [Alicycliphilus denitrificans]|uniref:diguanylate cyclase n=1 Tax=Alicycliphilus denitrificans TaxID=179636 RepID=A0A420KA49_9BURK|nr:GGDEF domain-containing protein [Alicycliphilus denitrificans]RKJ95618.1 GGDEF domain-containing protein [Alicycliphilus denitrificans]
MLPLDVPTMLLMTAASSLTMACSFAAVRPQRREGSQLWALGLLLHTATYVLYVLRGTAPDWASIVLSNMLLSGTFALALAAVCQFHGRALPWRRMLLPVLAMGVLFAAFIDDYRARLMVTGVVLPLQIGMVLWAVWRPQPPARGRGVLLFTLSLGLQVVLLGVRGVLAATYAMPLDGLMRGGLLQTFTFMTVFVVVILASLGFILMTKERADADNRYFATHDELTGVANRRALIQALDRDVAHAVRSGEPYALLMLDVDHFKSVNDGHGHRAGDQVLCHVAAILRARLRAQDLVGRYGGEEFVVLLPGTPARGAAGLAETLREAVEQTPCEYEGRAIRVTVSIGVCGARLESGDTWDRLIHAADQALYAAKAAGRNRVECIALAQEPPRTPTAPA